MFDRQIELMSMWRQKRQLRREHHTIFTDMQARRADEETMLTAAAPVIYAIEELNQRQRYLHHEHLIQRAERLSISPPVITRTARLPGTDGDESWERLSITRSLVLRPTAARALRAEIREELKARRDYALGWITPFLGLAGVVVGAILGYLLGSKK